MMMNKSFAIVALVALALAASADAAGCKCLGVSHPNATRFGSTYGSRCSAWDVLESTELWPDTAPGAWSCQTWCYVNKTDCDKDDVADSWDAAQTNLTFSFKACEEDPMMDTAEECPWSKLEKKKGENMTTAEWTATYNPCGCNGDSQANKTIFGEGYGAKCEPWDGMKCSELWPTYKPGGWCCDDWCYTAASCPTSSTSWSGEVQLNYNYGTCEDNKTFTDGCPWNAFQKGVEPDWTVDECETISSYPTAKDIIGGKEMLEHCAKPEPNPPAPEDSGFHVAVQYYGSDETCTVMTEKLVDDMTTLEGWLPPFMHNQSGFPYPLTDMDHPTSCFDLEYLQPGNFGAASCTSGDVLLHVYTDGKCKNHLGAMNIRPSRCAAYNVGNATHPVANYYKPICANKTTVYAPLPPPPSPPSPPPAPPAVADMSMMLGGYTAATFDDKAKTAFKTGVAKSAGVEASAVEIIAVEDIDDHAGHDHKRRLLASHMAGEINIDFQVTAANKAAAEKIGMDLKAAGESGVLVTALKSAGLDKTTSTKLTKLKTMSPTAAKAEADKIKKEHEDEKKKAVVFSPAGAPASFVLAIFAALAMALLA